MPSAFSIARPKRPTAPNPCRGFPLALHKGPILKRDVMGPAEIWYTIHRMEPLTTVTTAWAIAKNATKISKKLYELAKGLKDREARRQVEEILDKLRELKQSASELDD